ncbi:MAG TPA: ATP-binding protein, partial [Geminicoccaceae bacterium]
TLTLAGTAGLAEGHPVAPASLAPEAADAAWPAGSVLAGRSVTVETLEPVLGFRGGLWDDPVTCARAMPIAGVAGSPPLGMLVLGISPSRAFDDDYDAFFRLVGAQVGTALRNARAYEEERRRAEALAELDRAKTQFFSNVSHEFRTPLTLMLGPLEDVLSWDSLGNTVRAELQVAHRNALRLLRLVNTLLDFSRVEAGRTEAAFEPLDLSALTVDLASNFRSAIERGGLDFAVACPPLPEPAYVDREMWEKIVLNLVSNAFKYTFAGRIAVRLDAEDGAARLTVADTGVGIPAAEQARVFERFHRIEGIRSRSHEGSGIGLALVRELVGMHGGTVAVESAVRQGTTFTVTIPLGKAHLPAERVVEPGTAASETRGAAPYVEEALRWLPADPRPRAANVVQLRPDAEATPEERPSIVLADDNSDMRAYVERLLGSGYAVRAVGDGAEALAALKASPSDLLIADVMMPVLDGIALVREVRRDPALRMLPVIMLSARAGEEAGLEGLEAGADDYLVKPFSARELLARVRANLELARLRRETEEQAAQARKMEAVGQLTSGIAHDFNNLLAAIMGSVELSERRVADERVLRLLNNAMQAAQRGAKLTEQLLAFSRKQRLDTRPVDVNRIL